MTRCAFVLAAWCCCVLPTGAQAQPQPVEREVKAQAGRAVRIGVYTNIRPDCTSGPLPAIRLASAPAHGTVSVKRGSLKATNFKQCLAMEVPALIAFYRAAAEFSGTDVFELEISTAGGGKRLMRFRTVVSRTPAGGAGI
jgi:hypothetical protein